MNKLRHFERSLAHLESGDAARLHCAALEMRLCLEAIVYEKLKTYAARLPAKVKRKWQPDQALRALKQLEPGADEDFTLRIAEEKEYGVPGADWQSLGTHVTVKEKWVRKHYHKLGSYLHEEQPFRAPKYPYAVQLERMRESLEAIAEELRPAAHSSLDAAMANTVSFSCGVCEQDVVCNVGGLEQTGEAICLDPDCGAVHKAKRVGEGWEVLLPQASIVCGQCGEKMWVANRDVQVGLKVECNDCGALHSFKCGFVYEDRDQPGSGG